MKSLILLFMTVAVATAQPDGAVLFQQNCMACHQPEQQLVGPSLAEIRSLYLEKPDEFVKWSISPRKKRPTAIDMPSMVHLGEEGLLAVHKHIMEISAGFVMRKPEDSDPHGMSPTQAARPQVQRIFMPDAGPAAIAVALDEKVSLCWDAGSSRLRYAWTGGFIDGFPYWRGNGGGLARVIGNVRYREVTPPFPGGHSPRFLGYEMREGLPVFRYRIGRTIISETFRALEDGEGFSRSFTMNPSPGASLTMTFPTDENVLLSSDKGVWNGSKLTLTASEAASFTLTFSFK